MSLFEAASGLAVRYLSREHVTALRSQYHRVRQTFAPILRAAYGPFDTDALRDHLKRRVGRDFEILMVHSSFNNMKPMYSDSPLDLIRMLVDFCGPDRTLVMPAFYFGDPAVGGAHATFSRNPRFDLRRTPSQMGVATEMFRRWKGVVQSRHPVYRVSALGPLAKRLTEGHERAGSACGPGTPFDFMANHDTQIIGLGKPFEVLTQVHHAEDLLGDQFPVPVTSAPGVAMILVDGPNEIPFVTSGRSLQGRRNMLKLRAIMSPSTLREWTFHHVPMFATRAADVTAALVTAAGRGLTLYEHH